MQATSERWLPIPGYEGRYDVSDQGRVRSWLACRGLPIPHMLKGSPDAGYLTVGLSRDRHLVIRGVHRLVMLAFVGPLPEGMETRHLNGDSEDNRLDNLKYGTKSENQFDRVCHGNHHNARKTHCKRGHEFTPENTNTSNQKRIERVCRTCSRAKMRAYRARLRSATLLES